jgi:protein tyrosine phosphatase (PTP) superfamily phosphohydrolase (DUF442 family)
MLLSSRENLIGGRSSGLLLIENYRGAGAARVELAVSHRPDKGGQGQSGAAQRNQHQQEHNGRYGHWPVPEIGIELSSL